MFGQTAAVYGFNRVSKLLFVVASRLADLVISLFYDDFSQLEYGRLADSARETVTSIFELTRFELAKEPHKAKPFARVFDPLGVRLDFTRTGEKVFEIQPKPSRLEEVAGLCRQHLKEDRLDMGRRGVIEWEAAFFTGRLLWALRCACAEKVSAAGSCV